MSRDETPLPDLAVGFLGGGSMAEALVGGLLAAGLSAKRIRVADPDPERRKRLGDRFGVATSPSNREAAEGSEAVVLAVKPGVVDAALDGLEDLAGGRLWISIAAGVPLARLEARLGSGARLVRAMPNTPALVGRGATAFCANASASDPDRAVARGLFGAVGFVWEAPDEGLLDAVTGLSGSGPAFVFVFLEALADAGVRMGLPRAAAVELAVATVGGAAELVGRTGRHPAVLKDQVASPGGTTIAGLARLEAGGFRAAVQEAVAAATRRSRELSAPSPAASRPGGEPPVRG